MKRYVYTRRQSIEGWLAQDSDKSVGLFESKPRMMVVPAAEHKYYWAYGDQRIELPDADFIEDFGFEGEPRHVRITIEEI